MKVNAWTILLMSAHLTACAVPGTEKYQTSMDSVTAEKISRIIQSDVIPYKGENHGEVISRVSSAFLGTPYQADTLIGGPGIPEVLVANFNGVDCFTRLITLKPRPAAIIRNRFCIILPGLATPRAKLLISAAGTSSLTGSPQHRVMHGM